MHAAYRDLHLRLVSDADLSWQQKRQQSDTWYLILGPNQFLRDQEVLLIMLQRLRFPLINQHLVGATFSNKDVLISFRREDDIGIKLMLSFLSPPSLNSTLLCLTSYFLTYSTHKRKLNTLVPSTMLNVFRPTWLIKSSHLQHDMEVKRRDCCLQFVLVT